MEMIKRAISAIMALVLVLGMVPGVPLLASAEELETQPETVAVETTQAVTVPEETEAPETTAVPVETEPETTGAAEETVPQETAPEETVPEETAAGETAPEETVAEETVPEETEELEAAVDAADATISQELVTGITVSAATERTYVGAQVKLTAAVTPADAEYPDVEFYVVEDDENYTGMEYQIYDNIVIGKEAGVLPVAARALDEGGYDSIDEEENGVVYIEFVDYALEINLRPLEEENLFDGGVLVRTGESVDISIRYVTTDYEGIVLTERLTEPQLTWSLGENDDRYATLQVNSADPKEVTIVGKTVTETKFVTLYATDAIAGTADPITIGICPFAYKVGIYEGWEYNAGEEFTNGEYIIDLTDYANYDDVIELQLSALVWPVEAEEPLVWECSDGFVTLEHPVDEETEEEDTTRATLTIDHRSGSTTITVTSKNHPDISSTVVIRRDRLLQASQIGWSAATKRLTELVAGKSAQLVALNTNTNEVLESDVVEWYLDEEDEAFATIDQNGKLTAKNVVAGKVVTVHCAVVGNEEEATLTWEVAIRPLGTAVDILAGGFAVDNSPRMVEDEIVTGLTIPVDTADGFTPTALGFVVYPEDGEDVGAKQEVKWSSSNTAIATIDSVTNEIVWKKNGTVTITATTTDGSNKKASVKLEFGAKIRDIFFDVPENFFLRSGQSWKLDLTFDPVAPSNTGITWSLVGENDAEYATISANGTLKAKTVYEAHEVTVCAVAKDGSGVSETLTVPILPKDEASVALKGYGSTVVADEYDFVTKSTQMLAVDDSLELEACDIYGNALSNVEWKSSSVKTAEVVDNGDGTATVYMLKTGSATITATNLDNNKKTTVTVKGVRMTDYVEITQKDEQTVLASGKSLTLKGTACTWEGLKPSVSKLRWYISEGSEYATVTSGGKVTALAGYTGYGETVTVVAEATDGSGAYAEYDIDIYPIAQNVRILYDGVIRSAVSVGMLTPGVDTVSLEAVVYPANACQDVTWTTSNKKIATVEEDGTVTLHKAGSVTITATAADGSGKKTTIKLTVVQQVNEIRFENYSVIAGGKNLTLKPVALDGNGDVIKNQKFEITLSDWSYDEEDGTAYAKLSGSTLKTVKVTSRKYVQISVRPKDSEAYWSEEDDVTMRILICPATTSVEITNTDPHWATIDGIIYLNAVSKNKEYDGAYQAWTWKSSNDKIATVEDGVVVCHKAGTVTITATAIDGTGKKDTIKIIVRD